MSRDKRQERKQEAPTQADTTELEKLRTHKEALLSKAALSAQDQAEVEQIDDTLRQEQPVNPAEARHLDILRRAAKEVEARPLEAQQAQFAHWLCMAHEAGMQGSAALHPMARICASTAEETLRMGSTMDWAYARALIRRMLACCGVNSHRNLDRFVDYLRAAELALQPEASECTGE